LSSTATELRQQLSERLDALIAQRERCVAAFDLAIAAMGLALRAATVAVIKERNHDEGTP
jgi:hypothetical protein